MTDQQVRTALPQLGQAISQLKIYLSKGARLGAGVAPGVSRSIISADARKLRNAILNQDPVKREIPQSILYNDGWTALSCAMDVKAVAAKINQLSGWGR